MTLLSNCTHFRVIVHVTNLPFSYTVGQGYYCGFSHGEFSESWSLHINAPDVESASKVKILCEAANNTNIIVLTSPTPSLFPVPKHVITNMLEP